MGAYQYMLQYELSVCAKKPLNSLLYLLNCNFLNALFSPQ